MDNEGCQIQTALSEQNVPDELVSLVRGFFTLPVLSGLGRLGAFQVMRSRPIFTTDDFAEISNKPLLVKSFRYLARIGLLEALDVQGQRWKVSELGKQILQRSSSFYVPHSYHEYMEYYYGELRDSKADPRPAVDRLENIMGSGRTHQRYFPYAISFLKRRFQFDWIVDIGCGDGQFLDTVLNHIPGKSAVGIDLSEIAIQTTREHLLGKYPNREIHMIRANAGDIEAWSQHLLAVVRSRPLAISLWFLLHEISNHQPKRVIQFLTRLHDTFPYAAVIIGEIVRQEDAALAASHRESIMPEYLFFHDLSGQGVLSWKEYHEIRLQIPYRLVAERLFDEIAGEDGRKEPSSFIWGLVPS